MSKSTSNATSKPDKAVAYCRVACAEQTAQNQSIEDQKRLISEAANTGGLKIVQWYEAVSKDGLSPYRTPLHDIYSFCKTKQISYLLVASPDRISRRSTEFYDWAQKFQKLGVTVKAAKITGANSVEEAMTELLEQYRKQWRSDAVKRGLEKKRNENK